MSAVRGSFAESRSTGRRLLLATILVLAGFSTLHSPVLDQATAVLGDAVHMTPTTDDLHPDGAQPKGPHASNAEWMLHALAMCAAIVVLWVRSSVAGCRLTRGVIVSHDAPILGGGYLPTGPAPPVRALRRFVVLRH